jgi:hypothetical protein
MPRATSFILLTYNNLYPRQPASAAPVPVPVPVPRPCYPHVSAGPIPAPELRQKQRQPMCGTALCTICVPRGRQRAGKRGREGHTASSAASADFKLPLFESVRIFRFFLEILFPLLRPDLSRLCWG